MRKRCPRIEHRTVDHLKESYFMLGVKHGDILLLLGKQDDTVIRVRPRWMLK